MSLYFGVYYYIYRKTQLQSALQKKANIRKHDYKKGKRYKGMRHKNEEQQ